MSKKRRLTRIFRKRIFNNLDVLVKQCEKIAKQWDKNTIPLTLFKVLLEKMLIKADDKADENVIKLFDQYNGVLEQLYKTCSEQSKDMRSKSVSIQFVKDCIIFIKDKFKEGLNETSNNNSSK